MNKELEKRLQELADRIDDFSPEPCGMDAGLVYRALVPFARAAAVIGAELAKAEDAQLIADLWAAYDQGTSKAEHKRLESLIRARKDK